MKISPVGAELLLADGRTDGHTDRQTDVKKLIFISQFCERAWKLLGVHRF